MDTNNQCMLHIGILSSPGIGHIIPALVLGNRLAAVHNVKVTVFVITTANSPTERQLLDSSRLNIVQIPPVDISALLNANENRSPSFACLYEQLCRVYAPRYSPRINAAALTRLSGLFCTEALPVADELNTSNLGSRSCTSRLEAWNVVAEQITELAWGLELKGTQKIHMGGRPPSKGPDDAFFTTGQGADGTPKLLPGGLTLEPKSKVGAHVDRTALILKHPSPERELGVAIRPKKLPNKGNRGKGRGEALVKTILQSNEGKEMRERVVKLRMSAEKPINIGAHPTIPCGDFGGAPARQDLLWRSDFPRDEQQPATTDLELPLSGDLLFLHELDSNGGDWFILRRRQPFYRSAISR
nr:anthocyanidin 3-O-glucosyltransferase 5-like [Ipomoea batatas]